MNFFFFFFLFDKHQEITKFATQSCSWN